MQIPLRLPTHSGPLCLYASMPHCSRITGLPEDPSFLDDTDSAYHVDGLVIRRIIRPRFQIVFRGSLSSGFRADVSSMRFIERVELSAMLLGRLRDQARRALVRSLLLGSGWSSFQVELAELVRGCGLPVRELSFRAGISVKRLNQFLDASYRLRAPQLPSRSYLDDLNVLWCWLRVRMSSDLPFPPPIVTPL